MYQKLVDKFGYDHQLLKFIEEITELLRADKQGNRVKVLGEMVDVWILAEQIRPIFDELIKKYKFELKEFNTELTRKTEIVKEKYLNKEVKADD